MAVAMDDVKIGTEEGQFANETLARAEMKRRCLSMFSDNNIDKPKSNFKVGIESLVGTEEYNDFTNLVNIGIGDTVRVYYEPLDIDLNIRCLNIKCSYNFVTESWDYEEVELGDAIESYDEKTNNTNTKVNDVINKDNSLIASKVKGFLDATQTSLKASKQIGEKQDYRIALSEDLDPTSDTFGAMLWGSGRIFLSNKRTLDNKDWDYTTAITPDGVLAEKLIGRLLASIDGTNYFDLDTGIIKGKNLEINLTTGKVEFNTGIISGYASSWNLDTGVFKSLFWNGYEWCEIFIENGELKSNGRLGIASSSYVWIERRKDGVTTSYARLDDGVADFLGSNLTNIGSVRGRTDLRGNVTVNGNPLTSRIATLENIELQKEGLI
ncbi:MAG: phage tail spike protein, partial [Clostridium sp.]